MSVLNQAHDLLDQFADPIQHGAIWLVGAYQVVQKDIQAVEADAPFLAEAKEYVVSWARTHGVPVDDLEEIGKAMLKLAQSIAGPPVVPTGETP